MVARTADKPSARKPKPAGKQKDEPRRPGRPAGSANKQEQRNRLLDTAMKLFAEQGIAETPLSAIAREAGVTPALMHYYFNSRDQLLDALIDERIQPRRAALGEMFNSNASDPVTVITHVAEHLMQTCAEHPWFPALWMREIISDNGVLRQRIIERHGKVHYEGAIDRIRQWQAQGKVNPHIEPTLLFISIFGLIVVPLIASKTWNNDPMKHKFNPEDIARHAIALLAHGVSVP